MGCGSCGSGGSCSSGGGCSGGCKTGGCNKLNTFDWLSDLPYAAEQTKFNIVEVSFKNGSRKGFYENSINLDCHTGDWVAVEGSTGGYDIGRISLSGELVRLQMKKKRVKENTELLRLIRIATDRDVERLKFAKEQEYPTMLMARVIARDLDLKMKVGDVEYQGDGRKATFYYTADDRVDFRELIKIYAREFRVKIEMRQIGARQEAGRIGGIGTCGRELCCSTWLSDFKSVSTIAARYQNLAINQSKLSGQCGRLKCCLNYELDTYLDALQDFPKHVDYLKTKQGDARMVKMNIFKRMYWFSMDGSSRLLPLTVDQVKEVLALNRAGEYPDDLISMVYEQETKEVSFEDGVGEIALEDLGDIRSKRRRKKRKKKKRTSNRGEGRTSTSNKPDERKDTRQSRDRGGKSSQSGTTKPTTTKPRTGAKSNPNKPTGDKPRTGTKPNSNKPTTTKPHTGAKPNSNKTGNKPRTGTKPNSNKPTGNKPRTGTKPNPNKPTSKKMNPGAKSNKPATDKSKKQPSIVKNKDQKRGDKPQKPIDKKGRDEKVPPKKN